MPVGAIVMAIMPILSLFLMIGLFSAMITLFTSDMEHNIVEIPTYGKYDQVGAPIEPEPPDFTTIWKYAEFISAGKHSVSDSSTRTGNPIEGEMSKVAFPGFGQNVTSTQERLLSDTSWHEPRYKTPKKDSSNLVNDYVQRMPSTYAIISCTIQHAEQLRTEAVESGDTSRAEKFMQLLHVDADIFIEHYSSSPPPVHNPDIQTYLKTGDCTSLISSGLVNADKFEPLIINDNVLLYNKNTIGLYQIMSVAQSGFDGSTSPIRDLYDFFAYYAILALIIIAIVSVAAYWFKNAGFLGDGKQNPKNDIKQCVKFIIIIMIIPLIWDPVAHFGEQMGYLMQNPINPIINSDGTIQPGTSVKYVLASAGVNLHDQWGLVTNMFTIGLSIFTNPQAAVEGIMNQIIMLLLSFVRLSIMATLSMSLFFVTFSKIIAVIIVLATLPIWLIFQAIPMWLGDNDILKKLRDYGSKFNYTILMGALVCGPIMGLIFFIGEQTLRAGLFGYMEIIQWAVALMFMGLAMAVIPTFIALSNELTKATEAAQSAMTQGTMMAASVGTSMTVAASSAASQESGAKNMLAAGIGGGLAGGGSSVMNGAMQDMGGGELGTIAKDAKDKLPGEGKKGGAGLVGGAAAGGGGAVGGKGEVGSGNFILPALNQKEQKEMGQYVADGGDPVEWRKNRNKELENQHNAVQYESVHGAGFGPSDFKNMGDPDNDQFKKELREGEVKQQKFENDKNIQKAFKNNTLDKERTLHDYEKYHKELEDAGESDKLKVLDDAHEKANADLTPNEIAQMNGTTGQKQGLGQAFMRGIHGPDGSGIRGDGSGASIDGSTHKKFDDLAKPNTWVWR